MNQIVSFRLCKLSNSELLKKVDELTDKIYIDGKIPSRHIPARPDADYDLLVGELLKRFQELDTTLTISESTPPEGKGFSEAQMVDCFISGNNLPAAENESEQRIWAHNFINTLPSSPVKDETDFIAELNNQQQNGSFHPYTCNRGYKECEVNIEPRDYLKDGVLLATKYGWICPCGKYTQPITPPTKG